MFADDYALETIFVAEGTDWTAASGDYMFAKDSKKGSLQNIVGGRGSKISEVKSNNALHAFVDGKLNPKPLTDVSDKGYFTTEYTISPDTDKLKCAEGTDDPVTIPQGAQWLVNTTDKIITIVDSKTNKTLATYVPADSQASNPMSAAIMGSGENVDNEDFLVKSGVISAEFGSQYYSVSYEWNYDGCPATPYHTTSVAYGNKAPKVDDPTRTGYDFGG